MTSGTKPAQRRKAAKAGGGYAARSYRRLSPHAGERSFQLVVEQSDLWITVSADAEEDLEALALQRVTQVRAQLRAWMLLDPSFGPSLVPVAVPDHAPEVVRNMCRAASVMGVGPMATVAGAVAALTAEVLLPFSADCIVENGGDSMLHSTRDRVVALLPDPGTAARVGIRLAAEDFPVSLCASSASFGHSLSFGKGELAVVRSRDPYLADAAATAFCNRLREPEDAERVADWAKELASEGIDGVFVQCRGKIAVWGNMELVAL